MTLVLRRHRVHDCLKAPARHQSAQWAEMQSPPSPPPPDEHTAGHVVADVAIIVICNAAVLLYNAAHVYSSNPRALKWTLFCSNKCVASTRTYWGFEVVDPRQLVSYARTDLADTPVLARMQAHVPSL